MFLNNKVNNNKEISFKKLFLTEKKIKNNENIVLIKEFNEIKMNQ